MVVEPEGVEAESLRVTRAFEHLVVTERELGHVDADANLGHGRTLSARPARPQWRGGTVGAPVVPPATPDGVLDP